MKRLSFLLAASVVLCSALFACVRLSGGAVLQRPEGPCDVYEQGGAPCVAAHSTTRALYASYDGPLYQVMRQSDGKTLDINVVKATSEDAGGYADAAAQDDFCKDTYCWITILYDQSGKGNHLYQAPRGGFSGPAMGGYNNVPVADWAPINLMGHKVYGLFIAPGMGLRLNDPVGTAVDDQAEGQYWVISGHHYNSGCCFDYGNAETDSRDDGDGTMETTYFGNQPAWYYGDAPGPWIMTDQENNLVGCVNEDPNDKYCRGLETITWRFVTATADGEPHHWRSMGGNAQEGELKVYYDGGRIKNDRSSYDPMRKQGAILLGNGGDNSNGSSGTFYEAAMTAAGTFPTEETNQKIQANVVAAGYKVATLELFPAPLDSRPSNVQTYAPGSTKQVSVRFVNNTEETINGLVLSIKAPKGWKAAVSGGADKQKLVDYAVEPGQVVVVDFDVTSGKSSFNGDLVALAKWDSKNENAALKVRNTAPVKINEFSSTDSFIELFNDGTEDVDISGWTLTQHQANVPAFSGIKIPAGTRIAPKGFYLLGMANSGLAVDAARGDEVIYVRSVEGISVGDEICIDGEKKTVKAISSPAVETANAADASPWRRVALPGVPTTVWQPLPGGHGVEYPAGINNIPVTSTAWFKVGDKMAIGYGTDKPAVSRTLEKYEVVTITEVGKPGTQGYLSMDARPGDTNLKLSSTANISVGDKIRLDIESEGHGIETVTVTAVGTPSVRNTLNGPLKPGEDPGTGVDIAEPLKFHHASNMPYSVAGTGISFEPATKYAHYSNEPVLALVYAVELDSPLASSHPIDAAVVDPKVKAVGYQGQVPADLLFGGPAIGTDAGNITLRDAKGNIADAVNFGLVTDPWLGEGYQADSGLEEPGNFAPNPYPARRFGAATLGVPSVSAIRYPDGCDADDNKNDFQIQNTFNLAAACEAGATNIKINSIRNLDAGMTVYVGKGDNLEKAVVTEVGTVGASTLEMPAPAGSRTLIVVNAMEFAPGQKIVVGDETAVIKAVNVPRGWWQPRKPHDHQVILESGLRKSHPAGAQVAGTGLSLQEPLKNVHETGAPVATALTTPGRPNAR
ncbi:MAG: lamin tail domain-containing protein [Bacteroidales bacterium]|nr:lamin tail domain-containing protein [Bacteroidales bacterium]